MHMKQDRKIEKPNFLRKQKNKLDSKVKTARRRVQVCKKKSATSIEKELSEVKHDLREVIEKVDEIHNIPTPVKQASFFKLLTYNVWFALLVLVMGVCIVVFGPRFFDVARQIANAGTGTEGDPYTVCAGEGVCDYTTIQAAINNAGANAFISVQATYDPTADGNFVFDVADGITIDCNNSGAVIGIDASGKSVNLQKDNITIKNCRLNNLSINDTGHALLGFSLTGNTFTSSSAESLIYFTNAGTTNPSITSNTGEFRIDFRNIIGGTVSNNTITNYLSTANERIITLQGSGYTISNNTIYDYTGYDSRLIVSAFGNSNGIESSTISGNTLQFVNTVSNGEQGNKAIAIEFKNATSTSITSNYILLPTISGSVNEASGIVLGNGSTPNLSAVTISNNTVKMLANGYGVNIEASGGTPDVDVTYNLFFGGTAATGIGFACANTITTTSLDFDYNGFYNLSNNITPYSPCISSVGTNSKTTNPYLKTDDVDTSNDLQLAPFSDYLDVTLTTDIGAYNTEARGNSFVIDPSGTIDYSSVHATTTDILDVARNGDTFSLGAGTYDPLSLSSLSSLTIDGVGASTIINGGTTSSSLLLTNISDSTFQDFVVQNASSTATTYVATQMIFDYEGNTYGDTTAVGSDDDNYTLIFTSNDGCEIGGDGGNWNTDDYDVTSFVSSDNDWHLWLAEFMGAHLTILVPNQFYSSQAAAEAACAGEGEGGVITDAWITDVFQYSGGVMTYNSNAVAAAGVTLTSGMTNPPAITRIQNGYAGIKFAGTSSGNTVSNVTSTVNGYGIWFSGTSATNNVNDSILQNSVLYDLYSDTSGTNNVKNTSFTVASTTASGGGQMNVYEKFRAYVIDEDGNPLSGVTVNATSTDLSIVVSLTTGIDGYTSFTDYILSFILNDSSPLTTQGGYNPFSLTALYAGYDNKVQSTTISSANQTVSIEMNDNPSDPTGVLATSTTASSITVQWTDNSSNESSFILDYIQGVDDSGFPGTTSTISANSGTGATTTIISSLSPNTAYMVRIQAVGTGGSSNYVTSSVMYTDPNVPSSVVATPNGQNSVIVSWGANSNSSDTVYELYNATASTAVTSSTTSTSYTVASLAANSDYDFKVRAQYLSSSTQWTAYSATSTTSTAQVASSATVTINTAETIGFELTTAGAHTGTLNNITNGVASLTVASTPINVTLSQGQSDNIDTSDNGVDDMSVTATTVGLSSATFTFTDYTPAASSEQASETGGGGGGGGLSGEAASLSGIVINGVIRAITNTPSVFVTFLGIGDNIIEAALSLSSSFSGVNWQPLPGKTISYQLPEQEGLYTIYAKVRTTEGDTSVVRSAQVTYDKDAPLNPPILLEPQENQEISKLPFIIKGNALPFGIVEIVIAGSTYTVTADDVGEFTATILDQLVNGDYRIVIRQTDESAVWSPTITRNIVVEQIIQRPIVEQSVRPSVGTNAQYDPNATVEETTIETIKETMESLQSGREAYLLIAQPHTPMFERAQIGDLDVVSGDKIEVLLRPDSAVHSITARLYPVVEDIVSSTVDKSEFEKVLGQKIYSVTESASWVKGYLFEREELVDVYKGKIDLDVPYGVYKLVVTLNEKDGSRTHITKQIKIGEKGIIRSRSGDAITDGLIKIFVEKDGSFAPWDAENFGQQNPLPLDDEGEYSFSLPPGSYYLEVAAPGYKGVRTPILYFEEPTVLANEIVLDASRTNVWSRFWMWIDSLVN